jgi:hypothetical protein
VKNFKLWLERTEDIQGGRSLGEIDLSELKELLTAGGDMPDTGSPLIYRGYHGTYREGLPQKDIKSFGGFHAGTRKSAEDRLEQTKASSGWNKTPLIIPVEIRLERPLGSIENPFNETQLKLVEISTKKIKDAGFDGVLYRNLKEDPGSLSVLAFSMSSVIPKSTM